MANEHEINGLLTYNNILKRTSDQVDCEDVKDKSYYLKNSNTVLRHIGPNVIIEDKENLIKKPLNLVSLNVSTLNFAHSQLILDGIDIIKTYNYLVKNEEASGRYFVENKFLDDTIGIDVSLDKIFKDLPWYNKMKLGLKITLGIVATIILIIIIYYLYKIFVCIKICKRCCNDKNKKKSSAIYNKNNNEVQLRNNGEQDQEILLSNNCNQPLDNINNKNCKFSKGDDRNLTDFQKFSEININTSNNEINDNNQSTVSLDRITKNLIHCKF